MVFFAHKNTDTCDVDQTFITAELAAICTI